MLWVLKRTVSMRRFFWAPKTYTKNYGLENIHNFTQKIFGYLNLCSVFNNQCLTIFSTALRVVPSSLSCSSCRSANRATVTDSIVVDWPWELNCSIVHTVWIAAASSRIDKFTSWSSKMSQNIIVTCDLQQCGILTNVDSDKPVQPPFKLRNSKWCSVSSLTLIEYSND